MNHQNTLDQLKQLKLHGMADAYPGLLEQIHVDKFVDHCPFPTAITI